MMPRRSWLFLSLWVASAAPLAHAQPSAIPTATTAPTSGTSALTATPRPSGTSTATTPPIATGTPTATPTKAPAVTMTAEAYRARLARVRDVIAKSRPPVNAQKALGGLQNDVVVKRSDGATQLVHGDEWASWSSNTRDGVTASKLTGHQARELRDALDAQIKLLDEWLAQRGGKYYQPADAQAIVKQLEDSGQIRTQALWWQTFIARTKNKIGELIKSFFDWLASLLPKRGPSGTLPDLSWLLWVFWAFVIAILGVIVYFIIRAFGGSFGFNFSWLGFGRRKKAKPVEFVGEDAELLLLPPDELRQRAEGYAAQGNFREALRHRFIALLLHLDQRGVWRYDIRRTNWEHISALRREAARQPLVAPLSDLTQRFDRVRYGGADCTDTEWSSFHHDVQSLENQIVSQRVAEVAR